MTVRDGKRERSIKKGRWYWVPSQVFDRYAREIGPIGLALYNAYSFYAGNKATAFPSLGTLAKKLGVSVRTVAKYNKLLESKGLIRVKRARR